jgi:hypothetical protein
MLGATSCLRAASAISPGVSRRRPTSAAHEASAMICAPGSVVPTGVPGLMENWIFSLGQA